MAFSVLVLAICGSLTALQKSFSSIDTARCSTLAAEVMQSQVENLRLMKWSVLTAQPQPSHTFTKEELRKLVPISAADVIDRFTLTQTLQLDPAYADKSGNPSMMKITLEVTWTGSGGGTAQHSRTFTALYAKEGLYNYYGTSH